MDCLVTAMHPSLERALRLAAAQDPEPAAAAAAALEEVLRPLAGSPLGEAAWSGSQLSRNGFPVELAFVAGDPSLRWTAEVAGPDRPCRERLAVALDLYRRLGGAAVTVLPADLITFLDSAQAGGTLKYGAWIGGRHRRGRSGGQSGGQSTYKLYAEVPPEAAALAAQWERRQVTAAPVLAVRGAQLCMVGHHADAGRIELYYEAEGLLCGEVAAAMSRVGLEDRAPEVLDLLQQAYERTIRLELPCRKVGWSYSLSSRGEAPAFTFYTFANSLFGGDGKIRAALLRLCAARGWELPLYEEVSRPLASRRGFVTCHGLFGIVIAAGAPAAISFGLVPPEEGEP
jgi:hypothetical protein